MTGTLSVIVPIYGSEKYIGNTVKAILEGGYQNIELILVNDGSPDASDEICKRLAESEPRIIYLTKENGGVSSARNAGLDIATGEYVAFCDADDLPNSDMYEKLVALIESERADVAFCDIYSERDGKNLGFPWEGIQVFDGERIENTLIASMVGNRSDKVTASPVWGSVCRAVFKREIIENGEIRFKEDISFAEDLVFTLSYLTKARRAAVTPEALYFYTDNYASAMNSFRGYRRNMLAQRKRLVTYIEQIIAPLSTAEGLLRRLRVTERCYYHECVGNACRGEEGRGESGSLAEVRYILNDENVRRAFRKFDISDGKRTLIYIAIKLRMSRLIFRYYKKRLKKING